MSAIFFGNKKGISLIEILIVVAIILITLTSLLGVAVFSLKLSTSVKNTTVADGLAKEAIEATRNFRDGTNWDSDGLAVLNTGDSNPYHPEKSSDTPPKWLLFSGEETINGLVRKIVFEKVSRDGAGDIEASYNSVNDDPETRKVIVTVSWENKKIEIITYFTNWKQ